MSTLRSLVTIPDTVTDLAELRDQVNRALERLQVGNLLLRGLKLETQWGPPTAAPGPFESNLRLATDAGTVKLYVYDVSTGWIVVGGQT